MTGIIWEKPPPDTSTSARQAELAEALRAHPGEWALFRSYPESKAKAARVAKSNLAAGWYASFREGEFECVCRKVGDEFRVYIRYIGGGAS